MRIRVGIRSCELAAPPLARLGMNFVADPLLFLPTFYIFKEVLQQGTLAPQGALSALAKYKENCFDDWRNSCAAPT